MKKLPRLSVPGILFVAWTGALGLVPLAACSLAPEHSGMALWRIVDSGCSAQPPAGNDLQASVKPGLLCDRAHGYALLKDRCGASHYLVLPIARRSGIESAELLDPAEPPYLALAWAQRGRVLAALAADSTGTADAGDIGLAVNSRYGRSQLQLHVHIDLLRAEVRSALDALPRPIRPGTRVVLQGHVYRIDPVSSLTDAPFARVAQAWDARSEDERAHLTLAVAADGVGGFLLLSDRADPAAFDRGHAEELLRARRCS
jgi:CDP-diacylglycerol pyrophosphatase